MNTIKLATFALLTAVGCGDVSDDGGPDGSGSTDPHPSWLVGRSYTKGFRVENNIPFESEDKGISFKGAPEYKYEIKVGKSWSHGGTWKVDDKRLVLSSGETIDLSTKMLASCRIIDLAAGRMFADAGDDSTSPCPFAVEITAAACNKVGTYSHTESSNSGSSSSSSSKSLLVDADGFYQRDSSRSSGVCYGTTCKFLNNSEAPTVGEWKLEGTTLKDKNGTVLDVSGLDFTSAAESCGGMAPAPTPMTTCGNGTCESGEDQSCSDCSTPPPPAAPMFHVANNSSRTIYYLYAARCSDTTWGSNRLNGSTIQPGGRAGWSMFVAGCWDFLAVDSGQTRRWTTYNNPILDGHNYTWTLTDANLDP